MASSQRLARPLAAALALVAAASAAQDPCTLAPYDATTENGLGAAEGFVIEYCSEASVPAHCLDRGNYFINGVQLELTQNSGDTTMPFIAQVRRAILGSPAGPVTPDEIVAGPTRDTAQGVPSFPATQNWVTATLDYTQERFSVGLDAVQLTSACAIMDGDDTIGQFIGTDQSAGTPITRCWKGDPPLDPTEDCRKGAPKLRALKTALRVAPHGGVAGGDQEVPPVDTDDMGLVRLGPNQPGGTDFWLEVIHDIENPTAAHIHNAPPGVNGPIEVNLGDPTSPIMLSSVDMSGILADLQAGNLYVNIHTAANPGGRVRAQLENAGDLIFADGFESGDTSSWSNTVP